MPNIFDVHHSTIMFQKSQYAFRLNLMLLGLLFLGCPLFAANTVQELIDQAILDGDSEVTIPAGTYPIDETLYIEGANNFSILAEDVKLTLGVRERFLLISNCSNLLIRGLTLDHDPLPFTQATIIEHASDWSWLEAQIHEGYPQDPKASSKIEVFDMETGLLLPNVWTLFNAAVEKLDANTVRVSGTESFNGKVTAGDKIVIDCPHNIPHGVEIRKSTDCRFEDVTLHTSTSFGFFETNCHGTEYLDIKIIPGPSPIQDGEPRLRSLNADGIHSKFATLGPRIENCRIVSLGDDAIAINGDYDLILETVGNKIIIASKRDSEIQIGDTLRSLSPEGIFNFEIGVTAITPATGYTEQLNAALAGRNIKKPELFQDFYELTLSDTVSAEPGSVICSTNRKGNGFIVRNNYIGNKRARGILIKAENGIIEGNTIEQNHMGAIVLAPELSWMEAGFSRSVEIINNRINHCGISPSVWNSTQSGIISVSAAGDNGFAPAGGHLNIKIAGNRIDSCLGASILATSTSGLVITDNVMTNTHTESRNHGKGKGVNPEAAVVLINCTDVTLDQNTIHQFGGETFLDNTQVTSIVGEDTFSSEPANFSNYQLLYEIGSPSADDDQDQMPNLYEYVYGLNPTLQDAIEPLVWIQADTSMFSFLFLSPQEGRSDVKIEVQQSSTLGHDDWTAIATREGAGDWSGSATLTTKPHNIDPGLEQVEVSNPITSGNSRFYRLSMEQITD